MSLVSTAIHSSDSLVVTVLRVVGRRSPMTEDDVHILTLNLFCRGFNADTVHGCHTVADYAVSFVNRLVLTTVARMFGKYLPDISCSYL